MKKLFLLIYLFVLTGYLSAQNIQYLDDISFKTKIFNYELHKDWTKDWKYEGNLPALVMFCADWCAPCKMASPILDSLSIEYKGELNVYKVNIDKAKKLAASFGNSSIPIFLFIPLDGTPTESSGYNNFRVTYRNIIVQKLKLSEKKGKTE